MRIHYKCCGNTFFVCICEKCYTTVSHDDLTINIYIILLSQFFSGWNKVNQTINVNLLT